jgi:general secretion pathway protein A
MYLEYYKLSEFPFSITPDPKFLYFDSSHRDAYQHLLYGITSRKGFIALTGECGCGKSTICRAVLDALGDTAKTALILNPVLDGPQLLRAIVEDFGIRPTAFDRFSLIQALNAFLLEQAQSNTLAVIVIDEAQDLPVKTLEEVRLLSNLETASQKLLQIVLSGQQELNDRLADPALRQLRQRITVRYHISPMVFNEIGPYIRHRLKTAGAPDNLVFTSAAVMKIARYSHGIPRLINAICDYALLAGFTAGTFTIDGACVDRAEYQLEGSLP